MHHTTNGNSNGGASPPLPGRPAAKPGPDLLTLAGNISRQTLNIKEYLDANNIPEPTFDISSVDLFTCKAPEYLSLYASLKASLEDLERLIDGPRRYWLTFAQNVLVLAAGQVALRFGLFELVPAQGAMISLPELAHKAGLDVDRVSRVVRALVAHGIFSEGPAGFVSHNATSYPLHENEGLRCFVHGLLDEMFQASSSAGDALAEFPHEADSVHTPFTKRHGLPNYDFYKQDPKRAGRFARALGSLNQANGFLGNLRHWFPWESLEGTVVDVGGGSGHVSIALAKLFPHLRFIVQDSAEMLAEGEKLLTDDTRGRVSFMPHSFFNSQPVKQAGAFLLRYGTHNWCDRDVVAIFKAMVPGLEASAPDAPLLINDIIVPEPGTLPRYLEREVRRMDMTMLVGCGSKERTRAEFEALLKEADPRYEIRSVKMEEYRGILEVYLRR